MSALVELLYPDPPARRTPLALVAWWESRRPHYNRVVGSAGLVTLAGALVLHPDRPDFFAPGLAIAVLAYAVAANLCYTLGWVLELLARAAWGDRAPRMGPLLFREGLIFSVGLTLLPLPVLTLVRLAMLLGLGGP